MYIGSGLACWQTLKRAFPSQQLHVRSVCRFVNLNWYGSRFGLYLLGYSRLVSYTLRLFCRWMFACFGMVFPYPFANLSVATPNAMEPNCFDILQRPFASLGCQPRGYRFKPTLAIFLTMSKNVAGQTSLSLSLTYRVWSIQTGQYFRSLDPYTRKTVRSVCRFVFPWSNIDHKTKR